MKTVNDFLLVMSPPPPVAKHVSAQKQETMRLMGHSFRSVFSLAHVTLFNYQDLHTDSLLHHIQRIIAKHPPIYVSVKGLGFFTHGTNRTIFHKIDYINTICELNEYLRWPKIIPHITIARNIKLADFEKVWPSLKDTSVCYDFVCDHITVLIRDQGRWEHYIDLYFSAHHMN